jgi:ABC-type lipoprotein release transport system permease subunit
MQLIKLALRNLTRNRRRSLITMAAISGGLALFIWSITLATGSYKQMISQGVATLAGAVVIQGEGYQADREMDQVVHDADALAAELAARYPDARVLQRSFITGLLNSPVNSIGVAATAIQPSAEAAVSDWDEKITAGEFLTDDDDRGVVIGARMADTLGVEVGDKLVLMAQGDDDVASRLFRVRGVFTTGSAEMDGFLALIHLDAARDLLGHPDTANQISLHLPDVDDAPAVAAEVAGMVGDREVEVLTWKQALPEIVGLVQRDKEGNNLFLVFIGLIAGFGVLNTVLMSVMERIREFGVLLSLGMPKATLRRLVMLEGTMLGLVSVAIGLGLGLLASWPLVLYGIDFSGLLGMENIDSGGVSISANIMGAWDWERTLIFSAAGVVMCALASVYPAHRAATLQPVEALNHV